MTVSLFLALLLASAPQVTVTRWVSPDDSKPLSFTEWRASVCANTPWRVEAKRLPPALNPRVDFLVEESLYSMLEASLDTMVADLIRESTQVAVFTISGSSPESLRAFLAAEHAGGMTSVVLVGDLPIAWFQMLDDWDNDGRIEPDSGEHYEEFPCDLFFMDLDGTWQDNMVRVDTLDSLEPGEDGIYDLFDGSIEPEIAVSRLPASLVGNEQALLLAYFDRAHQYRNGRLPVTDRALTYVDDDWAYWALQWDENVGYLYPNRILVYDPETTRCIEYRPRIDSAAYQWIQLCSHSWPGGHAMKYGNGQYWDWFYSTQIEQLDPEACFYNLFACSNARFVERNFCGGCYTFSTSTGLGAVGSTKTGSMLEFQDFYWALDAGRNLGEALQDWFYWRMADVFENSERAWFMGMCCIGDGTLKPRVAQTGMVEERRQPTVQDLWLTATPNPFRTATNIQVTGGSPELRIHDAGGRLVRSIPAPHPLSPICSSLSWDGRDDAGRALPPGVYILTVDSPAGRASTHVTHIR